MKTKTLASLSFAEILDREIEASGKSNGQIGRESGIQDTLIGMYRNGHREPTLRNTRRLCCTLPKLLTWIASGSDIHPVIDIAVDMQKTNTVKQKEVVRKPRLKSS